MAKKLLNIQVDEEFLVMVKQYAKDNYMTMTAFIIRAINEYIASHK